MAKDFSAELAVSRRSGHDYSGGDRDDKRRQLGRDTIPDRKQGEALQRFAPTHPHLGHADNKASNDIYEEYDDACDSIAFHEFTCSIHRPVEARFLFELLSSSLGLLLIDQPQIEIRVDTHLLSGH